MPGVSHNHAGDAVSHCQEFQEAFEVLYGCRKRLVWSCSTNLVWKVFTYAVCCRFWLFLFAWDHKCKWLSCHDFSTYGKIHILLNVPRSQLIFVLELFSFRFYAIDGSRWASYSNSPVKKACGIGLRQIEELQTSNSIGKIFSSNACLSKITRIVKRTGLLCRK